MGDAFGESNQWISLNCDTNVNSKLVLREMRTTAFGLAYVFFLAPFYIRASPAVMADGQGSNQFNSIHFYASTEETICLCHWLSHSLSPLSLFFSEGI